MPEIKLTLNPTPAAEPAVETASPAAQTAVETPAAPEAIQEPVFTPEEQAQIDEFSKQIDVTDCSSPEWRDRLHPARPEVPNPGCLPGSGGCPSGRTDHPWHWEGC